MREDGVDRPTPPRRLAGGFDKDLAGGGDAERGGLAAGFFQRDQAGGEIAIGDAHDSAGEEAVLFGELEELGGLVGDADDAKRLSEDAGREGGVDLGVEFALGAGNRVAVRVAGRVPEEGVEAVEDVVGDGVFELFGLGVDARPVHFEDVDEKGFDEAVASNHAERHAAAGVGEAHAESRLMLDEILGGKRLDHGGHGAGDDLEGGGQGAHRDEIAAFLGQQEDVLEVVFNRDRSHRNGNRRLAF